MAGRGLVKVSILKIFLGMKELSLMGCSYKATIIPDKSLCKKAQTICSKGQNSHR
jgi:hypothetical protein